MSGRAVFVDESKANEYLLMAAAIMPADVDRSRRVVRGLLLPGQSRLHMKDERDSRKRAMLDAFAELAVSVTIYRAPRALGSEVYRRGRCLDELVEELGPGGGRLCIERDDTLVARDKQRLIEASRRTGSGGSLRYWHESATSEPLLAIPDAVGWAWARGGEWRRRALRSIVNVVEIAP